MLVNLSGGKVDSFWPEFLAFTPGCVNFVILVNVPGEKFDFLFGPISRPLQSDFVTLVNSSGEKVDFFLARFPRLYSCIDVVIVVSLSDERVDFFLAQHLQL